MNIYEIAKQAGVSPATVSRVINGNPRVGEENRKRVMAAIEASGFVPNFFARSLNRKKTRMVGILCPVISDINHARQVSLLEKRLRLDGFDILLCSLEQNYDDKRAYLELLLQKQVDAVFVIGLKQDESRQAGLFAEIASQVPVIIVNGRLDVPGVCCTAAGEFQMASELVCRLYRQGCRRIVYLYDSETYSGCRKRSGYEAGMGACGLDTEGRIFQADEHVCMEDAEEAARQIRRFLEETGRREGALPDAVLTADDVLAVPAQKVLLSMGRQVPVIGWNNSMYAQMASPALTSVDIRMDRMAEAAADLLRQALEGNRETAFVEIEPVLAVRESFVPEAPADGSA